jgi:hypothetical protein
MNIAHLRREHPPNQEELERIGAQLLQGLSAHLGLPLRTFKEHYVDDGALVLTFHGTQPLPTFVDLHIEGVLLFDVRSKDMPAVDAELLLFSHGKRIGLQGQQGTSCLVIHYDVPTNTWGSPRWEADVDEEWARIKQPRVEHYAEVVKTYDFE